MDYRSVTIASCWLAVTIISAVYMIVFGSQVGDVLFGVLLPVGLLVLVAVLVTVFIASKTSQAKT